MKSFLFFLLFLLIFHFESFSNFYWQQRVKYFIEVDVDVTTNKFYGKEHLIYYNNSDDTLRNVFFHLYYNAFQPGSMMDVRSRSIRDPDQRVKDRIYNLKDDEIGYHKILTLKQNDKELSFDIQGTVMEVILDHPLTPGDSTNFFLDFEYAGWDDPVKMVSDLSVCFGS